MLQHLCKQKLWLEISIWQPTETHLQMHIREKNVNSVVLKKRLTDVIFSFTLERVLKALVRYFAFDLSNCTAV